MVSGDRTDISEAIVANAIRAHRWPVTCILGKCAGAPMSSNLDKTRENATLACPVCGFNVAVPIEWYKMSSSRTLFYLLRNVVGISEMQARLWINNVKYTHPGYWASQKSERERADARFQAVISQIVKIDSPKAEELRLIIVGANNCTELGSLPFHFNEENILAIDVSDGALRAARVRYPNIRCCREFAEDITGESTDVTGRKLGQEIAGSFDVCLALRVFQSSRFQFWSALTKIRDVLKPGGWLVISVPRQTVLPTGNVHPGIYRSIGEFDEKGPKETVETLARELTGGSWMYAEVQVIYGSRDDMEYYILAQRNY